MKVVDTRHGKQLFLGQVVCVQAFTNRRLAKAVRCPTLAVHLGQVGREEVAGALEVSLLV